MLGADGCNSNQSVLMLIWMALYGEQSVGRVPNLFHVRVIKKCLVMLKNVI